MNKNFFFSNLSCGNESVSRKTSMESVSSNDSIMSDMSTTSSVASSVIMSELSVTTTSDNSELIKSQNGDGKLGSDSNCCTNNNSIPHEISSEELELLKKLEEQNR